MKDNFFTILMQIFEKKCTETKNNGEQKLQVPVKELKLNTNEVGVGVIVKEANKGVVRIFNQEEKTRFSNASCHFLSNLFLSNRIDSSYLEVVINQLLISNSQFITLEETKWALRNFLLDQLCEEELILLDLLFPSAKKNNILH